MGNPTSTKIQNICEELEDLNNLLMLPGERTTVVMRAACAQAVSAMQVLLVAREIEKLAEQKRTDAG